MRIVRRFAVAVLVAVLALAFHFPGALAQAQGGVELGNLTCKTKPGTEVKLFLRTSVAVMCTFKTGTGQEQYKGEMGFLGLDLRQKTSQTLYFTVVGLSTNVKMGAHSLAGDYAGASVSAGIYKKGYGTTMFVGGIKKSFSLVPSIDTFQGTGLAVGTSRLHLEAK